MNELMLCILSSPCFGRICSSQQTRGGNAFADEPSPETASIKQSVRRTDGNYLPVLVLKCWKSYVQAALPQWSLVVLMTYNKVAKNILFGFCYVTFIDLSSLWYQRISTVCRPQLVSGISWRGELPRWVNRVGCKGPGSHFDRRGCGSCRAFFSDSSVLSGMLPPSGAKGTRWWHRKHEADPNGRRVHSLPRGTRTLACSLCRVMA